MHHHEDRERSDCYSAAAHQESIPSRCGTPHTRLIVTSVPGTDVRYLRLLWKGVTLGSQRAGTGAYIFRTKVTLLPVPGAAGSGMSATTVNTLGLVRAR